MLTRVPTDASLPWHMCVLQKAWNSIFVSGSFHHSCQDFIVFKWQNAWCLHYAAAICNGRPSSSSSGVGTGKIISQLMNLCLCICWNGMFLMCFAGMGSLACVCWYRHSWICLLVWEAFVCVLVWVVFSCVSAAIGLFLCVCLYGHSFACLFVWAFWCLLVLALIGRSAGSGVSPVRFSFLACPRQGDFIESLHPCLLEDLTEIGVSGRQSWTAHAESFLLSLIPTLL